MNAMVSLKTRLGARASSSPLYQRWQQLPPRDRLALNLLAGFLALVMLYVAVWLPVQRHLKDARQWYQSQRELHQYIQSNAELARQSAASPAASIDAEQLQGLVTASAQQAALAIERYDNDGSGLSLSLTQVPFATLLPWLADLEQQGVELAEVSLDRAGTGKVDARLTLRAGQ